MFYIVDIIVSIVLLFLLFLFYFFNKQFALINIGIFLFYNVHDIIKYSYFYWGIYSLPRLILHIIILLVLLWYGLGKRKKRKDKEKK